MRTATQRTENRERRTEGRAGGKGQRARGRTEDEQRTEVRPLSWEWPSAFQGSDGYLVCLRVTAAIAWLELGKAGIIGGVEPKQLIARLLVDGWAKCFLPQHVRELEHRLME